MVDINCKCEDCTSKLVEYKEAKRPNVFICKKCGCLYAVVVVTRNTKCYEKSRKLK